MSISQVSKESLSSRFFSSIIEKISSTPKRISKLAIPIIVIVAMSSIPKAEAGPYAYGLCTALCTGGSAGWGLAVCLIGCLPLLGAPCP
jgi:hypothetical protein